MADRHGLLGTGAGGLIRTVVGPLAAATRRAGAVARRAGPALAFLLVLALWTVAYLRWALRAVVLFPGHEGDGPFQMFNPLRRIAAGQVGGVDFQYFHGLALPYLHYPIYALAGGDLFAAELARHLVALGAFLGAAFAVAFALTRRLTPALGLTAATVVLCEQLGLHSLITVGNASLGVRSTAPYFVLAALLAGFRPRVEAVVVGLLAGVGVLCGTEHGVAAGGMVGVVWAGRRWYGLPGGSVAWAATAAGVGLAAAAGVLLVVGGPAGAVGAVRYAFGELPHDQFWYFGVPPNSFLFRWADVLSDRGLVLRVAAPFAAVALVAAGRARTHPADRPTVVAVYGLLGYGALATVAYFGYNSSHYLEPHLRVAVVAGSMLGWRMWHDAAGEPAGRGARVAVAGVVAALVLAGPSGYAHSSLLAAPATVAALRADVETVRAGRCRTTDQLAAELAPFVAAIDADRAARGITRPPVIWSAYAGRLEAHYGVFHPACDYTIHALGPKRRAEYLDTFRRSQPDYVVTCRPPQYGFEEWLRNSTWDYYEEVILNYDVLATTTPFVAWHRKPGPWRVADPTAGRTSSAPDAPDRFTAPAPPGGPADAPRVVEVEYAIHNPLAGVPVVGGLPRYLLGPTGCENATPISLPPDRTRWSFPVFARPGETPTFFAGTFSLVGGAVTITRVHVRPLPATPAQVNALTR